MGISMTCFAQSIAPLGRRGSFVGTKCVRASKLVWIGSGREQISRPRLKRWRTAALDARMSLVLFRESTSLLLSEISDVNIGSLGVTAFVFFLTFWGGISFVKGSTKPRVTQASFTVREPASDVAKRTARYLMERAFVPDPEKDGRKGVVTFTGKVRASSSVASILVAVAASGLWSATYILNFVLPERLQSPWWGLLSLLSLAVVPWYWGQASREEEVKVMVEEEGDLSTLYLKGHRDEILELERAFNWKRNDTEDDDDDGTGTELAKKTKDPVTSSADTTVAK